MQRVVQGVLSGVCVTAVLSVGACRSPLDDAGYGAWRDQDPDQWQMPEGGGTEGGTEGGAEGGAEHRRDTLQSSLVPDDGSIVAGDPLLAAGGAGVETYVRVALAQNPAIRAAGRRVERLGARVPQVTAWDDPMFQIAPIGEMAQTAAGQVGLMTGVSQKVPFPGKLGARGRIADQDVAMALADLQQTRLEVVARTRRAFWSYYFSTRAIQTTRHSRRLLAQFKQSAQAQYRASTRSQADVLRASVELSNLDNELIVLGQRQATERGMINQLLDRPIDAALPAPPVIEPKRVEAQIDQLLATAARQNPSIQKVHDQIEQSRHRRKLARLNRWPDLTVSATYNAVDNQGLAPGANGDDQWWVGFGINLPIWADKYDAAEREALEGMLEGVTELTVQHNRIAFEVQDAYLKVEAQQKLVELFHDVIIPQARQTVDASASGYRAGSVDFLTLIDNWRKLLNFDLMYHRAQVDMEQAVADLERAVGQSVTRSPQALTFHDSKRVQPPPPPPEVTPASPDPEVSSAQPAPPPEVSSARPDVLAAPPESPPESPPEAPPETTPEITPEITPNARRDHDEEMN